MFTTNICVRISSTVWTSFKTTSTRLYVSNDARWGFLLFYFVFCRSEPFYIILSHRTRQRLDLCFEHIHIRRENEPHLLIKKYSHCSLEPDKCKVFFTIFRKKYKFFSHHRTVEIEFSIHYIFVRGGNRMTRYLKCVRLVWSEDKSNETIERKKSNSWAGICPAIFKFKCGVKTFLL